MAEYWIFWIHYDKWRNFCILLNVKMSFRGDIVNASVMFYNFVHERGYCNSDPNIWVDGLYIIPLWVVTCNTNYASNICDHSASYFYTSVWDTPWQYCKIWAFNNHSPHPVYDPKITVYIKTNNSANSSATLWIILLFPTPFLKSFDHPTYKGKLNNVERGSAFQEFECQHDNVDASFMYKWEYYFLVIKWHIRYSH